MFSERFGRTIIHPQFIMRRITYRAVVAIQRFAKGKLIDIGCGRMPYKDDISPFVDQYVGVDHPTVSRLYKSSRKPDVLADAKKLPFRSNTFDTAIMLQVLEYIDEPSTGIHEVFRVLKPKGKFILSIPFLYPIHDPGFDRARYTEVMLKEYLTKVGFKIVLLESQGGFPEFWVQSLQVFIFKNIQFLLSTRNNKRKLLLPLFVFFAPLTVLIGNISVVILSRFPQTWDKPFNYFPLNYLIVAEKK